MCTSNKAEADQCSVFVTDREVMIGRSQFQLLFNMIQAHVIFLGILT